MSNTWSRKIPRLVAETVPAEESKATGHLRPPATPDPNPYLAGEVIGDRYRLVRPLGHGGMGVVWVAHSLVLGVDVALKLIRASSAGPSVASRMAREAHAAARLGHPALVRVFDFGWTSRGDPFLVMELVQGETIWALLSRERRVDAIRAVQMILPIADGLRVAHDKHIVHRDIKPENIFLATDAFGRTQPKLLDFGIAKVDLNAGDGKLTQVGAVLGSPEYMSPEQALGVDDVDARTDVWSLSVVLYELVTGAVPFTKSNYNALMQSIINDEPTPMAEHGAGDVSLWRVVQRGLTKDRDQRWNSMTELGEALALWLYEHGIKEDLSGNSIRAVWLDGALSGVRADLPSTRPPTVGQVEARASSPSRQTQPVIRKLASTRSRRAAGRQRSALLLALALGVGLGGIGVAFAIGAKHSANSPVASAVPSAEPRNRASTVPMARDSAPAPVNSSVAEAKSASETDLSMPTDVVGGKRAAPKSPGAQKPPARLSKHSHDFGF
jgi:serine/threonine protein kinase